MDVACESHHHGRRGGPRLRRIGVNRNLGETPAEHPTVQGENTVAPTVRRREHNDALPLPLSPRHKADFAALASGEDPRDVVTGGQPPDLRTQWPARTVASFHTPPRVRTASMPPYLLTDARHAARVAGRQAGFVRVQQQRLSTWLGGSGRSERA